MYFFVRNHIKLTQLSDHQKLNKRQAWENITSQFLMKKIHVKIDHRCLKQGDVWGTSHPFFPISLLQRAVLQTLQTMVQTLQKHPLPALLFYKGMLLGLRQGTSKNPFPSTWHKILQIRRKQLCSGETSFLRYVVQQIYFNKKQSSKHTTKQSKFTFVSIARFVISSLPMSSHFGSPQT